MTGYLREFRWDWYQATIRESAHDVQGALMAEFPDAWLEPAAPRLGYAEAWTLRDSEGRRAAMQSGGPNGWPNLTGSGQDSPAIAALLRTTFPHHEVTRADSASDFGGQGTWERLSAIALEVADEHRTKVSYAGDWHRGEDGRTLYLGAPSSAVRCRVYEKGKEQRAKGVPGEEAGGLDVVRVEVQVRPQRDARKRAAVMEPLHVWGFARWAQDLLWRVIEENVPAAQVREVRPSNDDRALAFMALQYGPMLERQAEKAGGWHLVMDRVQQLHGENQRRREKSDG